MYFKTLNGFEINTPAVNGVKAADANIARYHAQTEEGTLTVQLFRKNCINSTSGDESDYAVQISAKKNTEKDYQNFSGCGRFLSDYRMNDIWALQKTGNTVIDSAKQFKGVPTLEIQLKENKAFGYGGCNRFSGSISLQENKIVFGPLASTKMACNGPNIETQYLSLYRQNLSYRMSEGMLYLGEGDGMLVFKKVD